MNKRTNSLQEHFQTLRNVKPISFNHSRRIIEASSMLQEYSGFAPGLRLDASLLLKRCFDFLILPILSAGLSVVFILGTGSKMGAEEWRSLTFVPHSDIFHNIENNNSNIFRNGHPVKQGHIFRLANAGSVETLPPSSEAFSLLQLQLVNPITIPVELNSIGHNLTSYEQAPSRTSERSNFGIMVGLRTMGFQNIGAGINPATSSVVENAAVSVSYAVDLHQSIGVEIGQECFARKVIVAYEVLVGNPNTGTWYNSTKEKEMMNGNLLTWLGAFYRYSLPEWNVSGVYPYGQILAGATTNGLLGKGMLGLEFSPNNSTIFSIASEVSYLNYSFQGTRQFSLKQAITAGVAVKW